MTIEMRVPDVADLGGVVRVMGEWQVEGRPMQLHPGDLGWFWRLGATRAAAAVRAWVRDGRVLAVGLLDGEDLLRVAMDPEALDDDELTDAMTADISRPERGVLPSGVVDVEAPSQAALQGALAGEGWTQGEPWVQLHRDLARPVEGSGLRVETVEGEVVALRTAVHRSAFSNSIFGEKHWAAMASSPPYAGGRCLVGFDDTGVAVAIITVWSAGPGRPGLIEPMGVHADHRSAGHGRSITLAGATVLRDLGASSVMVATPASNLGAVRTYVSAGLEPRAEVRDRHRDTLLT